MSQLEFLKEGLKNIKTIGTITRSSKSLCRNMVKHIDFTQTKVIVELGAGDGVITRHILEAMPPDVKLLAFEVNPKFCDIMRTIEDDRLIVVEDSAENIGKHLRQHGFSHTDCIVSAIPFVSLPKPLRTAIMDESLRTLRSGGKYIQVHYSLIVKDMYEEAFGEVDVNWVPLNVPPAFVLVCER